MKLTKDKSILQNFSEAIKSEWLETNGLGGYASSTLTGCNTRRYHGLLVAAVVPPTDRMVLVSKMDETVFADDQKFELGCNDYGDAIAPQGYEYLESFTKDLFPEFIYEAGNIRLKKTIAMVHGDNTTLILYEVLNAEQEFILELLPVISVRSYHELIEKNDEINPESTFRNGIFQSQPYTDNPQIFISAPGSSFIHQPNWYNHFEYIAEKERGLGHREDLFTYGSFRIALSQGEKCCLILSTENPEQKNGEELFEEEKKRRQLLFKKVPDEGLTRILALAADQFIVARNEDLKTIIAGYHWFTDWSRDTMIALNGLCLCTGRFKDAKKILEAFAKSVSEGMLPNRFQDRGLDPEYNSADGTLWYFVAVYHYLKMSGDKKFVLREILPVLKEIIAWHYKGTRYQIHVDDDGLLFAGEPGFQLTWMDAKVGDWVVTPRIGKAVEINALWYNALRIYAELLKLNNEKKEAKDFREKAKEVKKQFIRLFWNEDLGYLYDVVNGGEKDSSLRPNQLFALGICFPLIEDEKAKSILNIIKEKLYTPVGLRSLSPDHPDYKGEYSGNPRERDGAYHQGSVWSWLLGPYVDAIMRRGDKGAKKEARQVINSMVDHLNEAGIGSISEIFDGDEPYSPAGCIAQAWSVGELLRVIIEYGLFRQKKN